MSHSFGATATGDILGPGSSTDNAIAVFDGVTGKLLESGSVLCDISGIDLQGLNISNGEEITSNLIHATSTIDANIATFNDVTINNTIDGNAAITAASINFGGTALSSYDVNTFNPTVTLGGAGTVPVYAINIGQHIEVGEAVFVTVMLQSDGGAEGAGASQISVDLPFASNANSAGPLGIVGWYKNGATVNDLSGYSVGTTTKISLYKGYGTDTPLTGADQNNSTREICLHFWYWK